MNFVLNKRHDGLFEECLIEIDDEGNKTTRKTGKVFVEVSSEEQLDYKLKGYYTMSYYDPKDSILKCLVKVGEK